MSCEIRFSDSASVVFSNAADGAVTAEAVGGGDTDSVSMFSGAVNGDGSVTLTHDPGDGSVPTSFNIPAATLDAGCVTSISQDLAGGPQITLVQDGCPGAVLDLCSVTAPNGDTGQPSGVYVDACGVLDLTGQTDPETPFPAAGFVEWWRQPFTNGVTGSETWVVLADVNGVLQWHQEA